MLFTNVRCALDPEHDPRQGHAAGIKWLTPVIPVVFMAWQLAFFNAMPMGLRKFLLGEPSDEQLQRLLREGAVIIDIRTRPEFEAGHIPGAMHVPMDDLLKHLPNIPKGRPLVTCNAEDALSASAAELLTAHGFKAVDGGGWKRLSTLIKEERPEH